MRTYYLVLVLTGLTLLTGCTSLLSVFPLATAETQVFDEGLLGAWTNQDQDVFLIRRGEGQAYHVTYAPKDGSPLQFEGYLVSVGCVRMLDLTLKKTPEFTIAGHFFVRIELTGDTLRFAFMDSEWLRKQIDPLTEERDLTLLTSREVRQTVARYACEPQAYSDEAELERMK